MMATFIDLTKASRPETPKRTVILPQEDDASASGSSIQASRFYHYPLLQPIQYGLKDVDEELDTAPDDDRCVYPVPAAATTARRSSVVSTPCTRLLDISSPQSKVSLLTTPQSVDELQVINDTPTKRKGQRPLMPARSSRGLEVDGFAELPLNWLNIDGTSPSAKRRCSGLTGSSTSVSSMSDKPQPRREKELELAEEEDSIIDLTISENFPVSRPSKPSRKRGIPDLSGVSDNDGQARLIVPGIKRRLAALGRNIQVDSQNIIDLSADTDSDEEESEPTRGLLRRHSVIRPEDYLSDDEINKRLANLNIGPDRAISVRTKSTLVKTEIDVISYGNFRLKAGKNVELRNGDFLRIVSVLKDKKGDVFLSGHLLSRQNSYGRFMPRLRNELVWIVEIGKEEFEAGLHPAVSEVRIAEVIQIRSITFTNQRYPEMSMKTCRDGTFKSAREEITTGPLFCRWKHVTVIGDRKQPHEESLVHLTYAEADSKPKARVRPSVLRDDSRGFETVLKGSHSGTRKSNINLVSPGSNSVSEQVQQYTFGDAFCGAGGCSTGASQAGLRVRWGFDKDKHAIGVYAANLGRREGVECLMEAVHEFCGRSDSDRFMVDILHMSPPCQPFSPAHTIPSEIQDEINQAALFSVWHLLEEIKPRIATIEETEGLVNRHVDWFHALINIFISNGYSVCWKVVRCGEYGVPQQRRRLFIIAAG